MFASLIKRRTNPTRKHRQLNPLRRGIEILDERLVPAQINVTTFVDVVNANDGLTSLREAITRANSTAEADVISLQAGRYTISLTGQGEDANATGDFDITKPLTIVGQGMSKTIIDAVGRDRVFDVIGSINMGFNNLQITRGAASDFGGGINVQNAANITLDKSLVIRNKAVTAGGGINVQSGSVNLLNSTVAFNKTTEGEGGGVRAFLAMLTNSTVNANTAGTEGGGIFAGTTTLLNSTVGGNRALNGGGIRASVVVLTNSTVSANRAIGATLPGPIYTGYGAGIDANAVTLTNSTVSFNHADESGGGILASEGAGGTVKMTNSTVYGNSAGESGGGIWTNNINATNSTISGNSARASGGGIHTNAGSLLNVTITKNKAFVGGGVYAFTFNNTLSIKNSIIAQNRVYDTGFNGLIGVTDNGGGHFTSVPEGRDVSGRVVSSGHNLIGLRSGSTGFGAVGDKSGILGIALNPRLGPLANNGGPTLTHALLKGSPAIDAGDNFFAPTTDQRGVVRHNVDIGAFEVFQLRIPVDSISTLEKTR